MFETIIVGVDGEQGGTDALALARQLAGADTAIVAISVAEVDRHTSRASNADFDRVELADAETRLQRSVVGLPGVTGEVVRGACVAEVLHEVASERAADLIVVGRGSRTGLDRMLAGDDALATLREAPCPVAVAPPEFARDAAQAVEVIGVGWDGRPEAKTALAFAQALAGDTAAQVRAHEIIGMTGTPGVGNGLHSEINTYVAADEDVPALMAGTIGTTATGLATDSLCEFAAEVDVLVVGSRGRGRFARVVLGSTGEELAKRAERPLIVVPRSAQPSVTGA